MRLDLARAFSRARRAHARQNGQKLVERAPANRAADYYLDPPRSEHAALDPPQLFTQLTLLRRSRSWPKVPLKATFSALRTMISWRLSMVCPQADQFVPSSLSPEGPIAS